MPPVLIPLTPPTLPPVQAERPLLRAASPCVVSVKTRKPRASRIDGATLSKHRAVFSGQPASHRPLLLASNLLGPGVPKEKESKIMKQR